MHTKRRAIVASAVGLALAATAACGGGGSSGAATKGVDTTTVKMAFDSQPDIGDLPALVAMQTMRAQGYDINPLVVNGSSVTANAVSTGGAQLGSLNGISVFQAVLHGSPFVMFGEKYTNEEVLVAKSSITSIGQLNNKTVNVQSPNATSASLVLYTEKTNHLHINFVYQPNSASRAAALVAGQVDASPLELDDVDKILSGTNGAYHVLISYDKDLPWILGNVFFTNKTFLSQHKSIARKFMAELAKSDAAAYANPDAYIARYGNLLKGYEPAVLKRSMEESAAGHIWGSNGSINEQDIAKTLNFDKVGGLITGAQSTKLAGSQSGWFQDLSPTAAGGSPN
jgi:NitT/TauT family transport system substrate-binding protein